MVDELQKAISQATAAARADGGLEGARRAIRQLKVPALLADDHGLLVAANEAAEALTGYGPAELVRLTVPEITGFKDQQSFAPLWRAFIAIGVQYGTYELVTKRGEHVPVEYAAATVAPGLHLSLMKTVG